ncbi:AdeC/AdeK/OprM family multidrug efflux complex outer membrane factor [Acinetobacter sp. B5B]|uniref:AdeC/AdeK/OprM family multidrug efflux complex outer membrane factor n=1 Tax=Acinetobacter baretiae TaxID=2605383 RepID=UPI0018C33A3A|nr:AdeC/AdeK/OprM family multidrug efflux complex outer membrane factor [Acinetobacter baretiae]MBF7683385.1 AdeC/AdeK/OprM family multidrug efflux complex outer membrane factor [Acinetobacter baretiae]MBF7684366.1 AdeC/AdeK/OprM family multidrug efflux complex outer membrane factor [Acinetobacter baretiae]
MQNIWSITGRSLAVSTLAIALAACQSMRGPEPAVKADIPANYASSNQAQGKSIAEQGYKDFFSDARLIQVIDLALNNNRDLRTAVLNIEKAQAQYRITENNRLPTLNGSTTFNRVQSADTGYNPISVYSVGLAVTSYELDFWGRVKSLKDAALDNYLALQSTKDATQISLISSVSEAWLNYSYASANLKLAEDTLKTQLEAYQLNKKRFDVGIDSEVPLRQAEISVETARADVGNYKTQMMQASNALNLLVGQSVPKQLLPSTNIKQVTKENVFSTGLSSDLLTNRPDLQQAAYSLSAMGANIGAAKAQLYPNISLTSSAGLASTDLSDLFKSGSFIWSVAPSLNIPIFDWGTRKANIKIAKINQEIALASYEKSIQTAFREVSDALATKQNIGERLQAQNNLVNATNRTYALSNARYRAGIDGYLTVLSAQKDAYNAQKSLLALEQSALNNQVELYKTLGGGVKMYTTDQLVHQAASADIQKSQ